MLKTDEECLFCKFKIIPDFISPSQTDKQKTAGSRKCVGDAASHLRNILIF